MIGIFGNLENFSLADAKALNIFGNFVNVPVKSEIVTHDNVLGTGVFIKPRQDNYPTVGVRLSREE